MITSAEAGGMESFTIPNTIEPLPELDEQIGLDLLFWMSDIIGDEARLEGVAEDIAKVVDRAYRAGSYILLKTAAGLAEQFVSGWATFMPCYSRAGETFDCSFGFTPLVDGDFFSRFPIVEGGTLIRNDDADLIRTPGLLAGHVTRLAGERFTTLPDISSAQPCIISTARSDRSAEALMGAGYVELDRGITTMLNALTCDDRCRNASNGSWTGLRGNIITVIGKTGIVCGDCVACPANIAYGGDGLRDACRLFTPDPERAREMEWALAREFNNRASEVMKIRG